MVDYVHALKTLAAWFNADSFMEEEYSDGKIGQAWSCILYMHLKHVLIFGA